MNISKLLKFVQSLPEAVRCVLYVIYLLTFFLKSMKTFFVPNRKRFVPEERTTAIPRETPDGIVHDHMTDHDIHDRFSADNAMEFDPAYLASHGIEPKTFGGSIVSPLDATESLIESFDDTLSIMPKTEPKLDSKLDSSSNEPSSNN